MQRNTLGFFGLLAFASLTASSPAMAGPMASEAAADACVARDGGLSVSRVVEIDTSGGPLFGAITSQVKEGSFLGPKEIVLTFDDGPMPWVTSSILDTLDKFCTKATFFAVGKMAVAYPSTLRKIVARGHTVGGHTWSHPLNLKHLKLDKALSEIEKGMAAISLASGGQAAPFFRFPGLSDNAPMLAALQKRGIASFTVDVVSDDSYISNPAKLVATTLARVEARNGGILLFHDIKPATAKALPTILSELKRRGYKIVHMRAKAPVKPLENYAAELQPVLAKRDPPQGPAVAKAAMMPFFGTIGPQRVSTKPSAMAGAQMPDPVVQTVAPPPRDRTVPARGTKRSKASAKEDAPTPSRKPSQPAAARRMYGDRVGSVAPAMGHAVRLRGPQTGEGW